jgi:hypothetical protein
MYRKDIYRCLKAGLGGRKVGKSPRETLRQMLKVKEENWGDKMGQLMSEDDGLIGGEKVYGN